eukprot:scpid46791/ scgid0632/ Spermatogenesis-defective protein 39 homolog; VPS33B-interacting protein in polarity and apical restriction
MLGTALQSAGREDWILVHAGDCGGDTNLTMAAVDGVAASSRRAANPFDSDAEDEALDPVASNFGEDDDEEGLEVVDSIGNILPGRRKKHKEAKLKGAAKSVDVLDDEGARGDAQVIGTMWEPTEMPAAKVRADMRSNYYQANEPEREQASPATRAQATQPVSTHQARAHRPLPPPDLTRLGVKDTAKRIVLGKPYVLECYRSITEKADLLKEVVAMHDGNAILTVILFLRQTLRENVFLAQLLSSEVAENHYVSYLRQLGDLEVLERFYRKLIRARKAGMLLYKQYCASSSSPSERVKGLQKCIDYFSTFEDAAVNREVPFLKEELLLLKEVQIPLQRIGDEGERKQYSVFVQFPRARPVTSTSLLSTVYYSCLYHFSSNPERDAFAPERLRRDYKLTDRQYMWMAIGARSKARDYKGIEERLLTVTGWFGRKNQKAAIGFEKVAEILRQMRAPEDEVVKYLRKTDDVSLRLEMAQKLDCPAVIIETLKEKRDRVGLTQYHDRLPGHSSHRRDAANLLQNSTIRWKN